MALKTKVFDPADYLTDAETIRYYLLLAFESEDPQRISKALGAVARARGGITKLARATGLSREALHRALSDTGNPEFATVLKVMTALGVRLVPEIPKAKKPTGAKSARRRAA
jgi:probable addiction module antidote protein